MADIGLPKIDILFKGLGVSAVQRGSKGTAVLIVKDDTDKTFTFARYTSAADLTTSESAKYTAENLGYIKDCLEGTPKEIVVARMNATAVNPETMDGLLAELLTAIKGQVPMNCWIAMAGANQSETDAIVSFVKSSVKNDKKRYKTIVYKATTSDDMHIHNLTNEKVEVNGSAVEVSGKEAIPFLLGLYAGLSLNMSVIAKPLQKFKSVKEPANLEAAVNAGELVLHNDEGEVRVARGVNSLVTTGEGITDDMKFTLIVEVMDLMFSDIFTTWKRFYKGKYKNHLDNQMLLIGAINAYFETLENESLLDPNFENKVGISIEKQRLANIPKYGAEEVATWDDNKVMQMTVGTDVFLKGNVKILNAMEDFALEIDM
ncbi:phage tail sheath protein [Andreesenia angusta]|uniref:Phage tail sheath protein n=1 Tax=Andreesenia angusta TaxID=39480 RepID=A0A1S1V8I8_9FIRM|nr:phage tail sheath C-terminal domain-containing protein [Andreesenia angusta]OHW62908.1 phage tail sheath protein [Andreesenia angusta]